MSPIKYEVPAFYTQCPECGSICISATEFPIRVSAGRKLRYGYAIYCENCNFSTQTHHGPERARKEWNSYVREEEEY